MPEPYRPPPRIHVPAAAAVSKAGRVTSAKSNRFAMSGGEGVRYFSSRRHAMPSHACQPSRIAGDILKSA